MRVEQARAMRNEHAWEKKRSKAGLAGALVGLTLVAGTLFATGGAPAEDVKRGAAQFTSTTAPERISPRDANADRDVFDLQLD